MAPVQSNGIIWDGTPGVYPSIDFIIGPTMGLPEGFMDIMFINQSGLTNTTIIGNFYLCMSGSNTLAQQSDIVPGRSTKFDILLFNNRETATKVIKRRTFTNNRAGNEIIIRFQQLSSPYFNFYSGSRERNTDYLLLGSPATYTQGMFRFLVSNNFGNGEFRFALEADQVGYYLDGFVDVAISNKRGKFVITNCIVDEEIESYSLPTLSSSSTEINNALGLIETVNTEMSVFLGGNTLLFQDGRINFQSNFSFVIFGNVIEHPFMNIDYLFDMPISGNLYFHNNVVSSTINNSNTIQSGRNTDYYKNRYSDFPIIDYTTYWPIEEEHTVHHHVEKVSIVDDAMEEMNVVDRTGFDSDTPFDIGTYFDSFHGIPYIFYDLLQHDIYFFERKGNNNKGDGGAICLSYEKPQEEIIEILTVQNFISQIEKYCQHQRYNSFDLILPEQITKPITLVIKNNINIDYLFMLGMWMGRHGGIYIKGFKNLITHELPIIEGNIDILDGNIRMEICNIKLPGNINFGSTLFPSEFYIYGNILRLIGDYSDQNNSYIKIGQNWTIKVAGNTFAINQHT